MNAPMKSLPLALRLAALSVTLAAPAIHANDRVVVVANAEESYTDRKFGDGKAARESYVIMQGRYFGGTTADSSLRRMTIRDIVSYLVPQLAEQNFVPAKTTGEADLVLAVHWGVTNPRVGRLEMMGRSDVFTPTELSPADPSASTDEQEKTSALNNLLGSDDRYQNLELLNDYAVAEHSDRNLAQLLGYTDALRKHASTMVTSAEEQTLRSDLSKERYFIIVRAYELRTATAAKPRRPVWTLHLNVSSPGNNFRTAMTRMSHVAPDFVGRTSKDVQSVRARAPSGKVDLGDAIILGMTP
jgi:hypothetical protein